MNVPCLLEHHDTGAGVQSFDIEVSELRKLSQLFHLCLVTPNVRYSVSIRNEIHRVINPDRIDVLRVCPWWRYEIECFQIDDPDGTILAASIIAALFVPRVVHAISDV